MKHWLPPSLILIAIGTFCLWDSYVMQQETIRWQAQLMQAEQLAAEENWPAALEQLENSHQDWQSRQLYVHIISRRDAVDDAEAMYHRAMAFAKTEEITEFRAELSDLQDQMRVLCDLEAFRLHSIF